MAAPAPTSTGRGGGGRSRPPVQSSSITDPVINPPTNTGNPPLTTAEPTTTTTTITTTTFSTITADLPSSSSSTNNGANPTVGTDPAATPWGLIDDNNTNGPTMLTVSLVVVFVVLAGLGAVVFCLFRTRRAKARRAMRSASFIDTNTFSGPLGSGSSKNINKRDSTLSLSGVNAGGRNRGSGIFMGTTGSANGSGIGSSVASEIDISRALQEMSELHQSHRLSKRSSTLSLGHSNRMLSPTMPAAAVARPSSMQSGYWSGSNSGTPGANTGGGGNSRANSIIIGSNGGDYISSSPKALSAGELRNSHYDEYHGRVSPIPPPLPTAADSPSASLYPQAAAGGSSSNYNNSNEHLQSQQQQQELMQEHEQDSATTPRHSIGTRFSVVLTDRSVSPPPLMPLSPPMPAAVYGRLHHSMTRSTGDLRPVSMMQQTPATLVIPPSITTRRRSMMNTHSMYLAQGGAGTPTSAHLPYMSASLSPPLAYQYSQFSPPQQQPYQFQTQQTQQHYADLSYQQQQQQQQQHFTTNYEPESSQRGGTMAKSTAAFGQSRGHAKNNSSIDHHIEIATEDDEARSATAAGVGVGSFESPAFSSPTLLSSQLLRVGLISAGEQKS
ncbi:hypothetical protein BGZ83_008278 [Gryganskiella cystojenkinii]|nr:hypothetical protein BGZ83_008278 [Gryganskiella cystojenkinii]